MCSSDLGAGTSWPGGDAALLAIIPGVALLSMALVIWLRGGARQASLTGELP